MKKSLSVFILLLLLATSAKAQKEVVFKMGMMPQQNYVANTTMDMDMEMNMIGDTAMINKAKQSGQAFPILMKMQSASTTDIKTGALNAQNEIPFSMSMKTLPGKMVMNGKETPVPVPATDQIFYGAYTDGVIPRIDSVGGKAMDAATKETIVKLIEGIQENIKFPDKPMKIGDTFETVN